MRIDIQPNGIWYHGSPEAFTLLRADSTITQWRALAEAFSHKPTWLSLSDDGKIAHNGAKHGYLYVIDEPVALGADAYPHPRTAMPPNAEFLTSRPLKVRAIAKLPDKRSK